jgi:hypothetical protein
LLIYMFLIIIWRKLKHFRNCIVFSDRKTMERTIDINK